MKILIAYDGSTEAERALGWAARLEDAVATVIGVVPTLAWSERVADAVDATVDPGRVREELQQAVAKLTAQGIPADAIEKAGNPAEVIIETAEAEGFDLIVIGTRGRHAIARFLFGSTAERVAWHATVPVLLVR